MEAAASAWAVVGRVREAASRFAAAWPLRGWAALGVFWLCVLGTAGGTAALLGWLGPPPERHAATTAATSAEPARPAVPKPGESAAPAEPPKGEAAEPSPAAAPPGPRAGTGGRSPGGAVEPALQEAGPHGPLPRVGPDGRTPIRAYGNAFDRTDTRPRIGLVVGGLGMNAAVTEEAIRRLPPAVTLAFSPYASRIDFLLEQVRAKGGEMLVALPLEPAGHPTLNNAGNRALLTRLSPAENRDHLEWALSRFGGYVGAVGALGPMRGERFAEFAETLHPVQEALRARGLLYVDPRPGARPPERAWGRSVDIVVDEPATRGEIERKLEALERLARERGTAGALGYAGEASPVLVDRIAAWAAGVEERGLALAPVSAMIRRPSAEEASAQQPAPRARAAQ
ncbi:MAG: divergent polysaccharide deacetylase family protein [Acetobacteraceae bacterium]|nr:divergent polysaccharide deacetylase family protein [Acetobacteraceae bacterium]